MDSALKGLFGGGDDQGDVRQSMGNNPLEGLFGGGDDDQVRSNARDFIGRYEDGDPSQGFSDDEAMNYLQGAMQRATPKQMERASQQALSRMNDDQRREFAEMLQQRQTGGVDRSRSGGGGGGGGLDDMLGGLLGGGGGGLGGMLGGLMDGGGGGGSILGGVDNDNTRNRGGGGDTGGMLGGLMGSTAGKAVVGGIAAYLMKELLDGKR